MILQAVDICMTFPGKYPQIPGKYLQKIICEREMYQGWTSSFSSNIFPDMLTVCSAMWKICT